MRDFLRNYTVFLLFFSLASCGPFLKYQSKGKFANKVISNQIDHTEPISISVYSIANRRHTTSARLTYPMAGTYGGNVRYLCKMMVPTDFFAMTLMAIPTILTSLLFPPRAKDLPSAIDPDDQISQLQLKIGKKYELINNTSKFKNEKEFIRHMKKQEGLFMVFHTCELEKYPMALDAKSSGSYTSWKEYSITLFSMRLKLFYSNSKMVYNLLDYRKIFLPERLSKLKIGDENYGFFEKSDALYKKLIDESINKITNTILGNDNIKKNNR